LFITGAPCLSFDVIEDNSGDCREDYPLEAFIVAGTQAERSHTNNLIVMKMSNLHKTKKQKPEKEEDEEEEESESEDEDEDQKPQLETAPMKHTGCINRVRATRIGNEFLAATWSETGKVHIWDLKKPLLALNDSEEFVKFSKNPPSTAMFTFAGHQVEGFALDWCKTNPGELLIIYADNVLIFKLSRLVGNWRLHQEYSCLERSRGRLVAGGSASIDWSHCIC
jgi:ribosome assembly protein RRB1